ncbi:MAG: hypothetical protein ABIB04_04010 [Patescibacteria group bacterium]
MLEMPESIKKDEMTTVESISIPVERRETIERVLVRLKKAFTVLNLPYPKLPKISIEFRAPDGDEMTLLGHTEVTSDGASIPFDKRLLSHDSERTIVDKSREKGIDYHGIGRALVHEIGHISMWSVVGHDRVSASTRLIDEGWASLIERAGMMKEGSILDLTEQVKADVGDIIKNDPKAYEMFLDLSHSPASGERVPESNAAEYVIGPAFLLWINQTKGKEAMIKLLKSSSSAGLMGPGIELHPDFQSYISEHQQEATLETARRWESDQFQKALMEATGLPSLKEIEKSFNKWITGS